VSQHNNFNYLRPWPWPWRRVDTTSHDIVSQGTLSTVGLIRIAILSTEEKGRLHLIYHPYHPVAPYPRRAPPHKIPASGTATVLSLVLAMQADVGDELNQALQAVSTPEEFVPSKELKTQGFLSEEQLRRAEQAFVRDQDSDPLDITLDTGTLQYLQYGTLPNVNLTLASVRRLLRRASRYKVVQGKLYRVLANGQLRYVPPIQERESIIKHSHASAGHFGKRRTLHLLTR